MESLWGIGRNQLSWKQQRKNRRKCNVKHECIDEVDTVESMKEVERKLWLTHYDMLSEKLMEVIREKCTGCQMNEPNQLGHELCLMSSSEEQVNLCFGEVYKRVIWDEVLDNWYKKVVEMPFNLNPETLVIFRETVNPKELTYKDRLRKWLIESPTIELWIRSFRNFMYSLSRLNEDQWCKCFGACYCCPKRSSAV